MKIKQNVVSKYMSYNTILLNNSKHPPQTTIQLDFNKLHHFRKIVKKTHETLVKMMLVIQHSFVLIVNLFGK